MDVGAAEPLNVDEDAIWDSPPVLDIHPNSVKSFDAAPMNCKCDFCGAKLWKDEARRKSGMTTSAFCCSSGHVRLAPYVDPPEPLRSLLRDQVFLRQIRAYNSALAFTSVGMDLDESRSVLFPDTREHLSPDWFVAVIAREEARVHANVHCGH